MVHGPMKGSELEELRQDLSKSGQFRKVFGGRPRLDQVGHLVCEVRQALMRGQQQMGREAFFDSIEKSSEKRSDKYQSKRTGDAEAITVTADNIARYALMG